MDLIVDLPNVLQSSILREWLNDPEDVCRLDSAYCNRKLRPGLLHTLGAFYMVPTASTDEEDVNTWLFARNIKAVDLTVHSDLIRDEAFIRRFCGEIGSKATSISFQKVEEDVYADPFDTDPYTIPSFVWPVILENCSKLRKLSCTKGRVDPSLCAVIAAATQLREISFEGARNLTAEILRACCDAPHLEVLNIQRAGFATSPSTDASADVVFPNSSTVHTLLTTGTNCPSSLLKALLGAFPNLSEVNMSLRVDLDMLTVAQLTPNIRTCTLSNLPAALDATIAAELCTRWRSIQTLKLSRREHAPCCTDEVLVEFLRNCPSLQTLHLMQSVVDDRSNPVRQHYKVSTTVLSAQYRGSRLMELQTAWMSAETLQTIINMCPLLAALHLFYPMHSSQLAPLTLLHNTAVKTLALEGAVLDEEHLSTIRNMEHVFFLGTSSYTSSHDWATMARQNPNLRTIVLSDAAWFVNHTTMIALLDASPKLETFVFESDDHHRTDTAMHGGLNALIRHCYKHIRTVNIAL